MQGRFPSSLLLISETKGRNARFHHAKQSMEWPLEKAGLSSSLLSFPMTALLKRDVSIEEVFTSKSTKLWYIASSFILYRCWGCTTCMSQYIVFFALCVHTHYVWSEKGILEDLCGWKPGVPTCFFYTKELGSTHFYIWWGLLSLQWITGTSSISVCFTAKSDMQKYPLMGCFGP